MPLLLATSPGFQLSDAFFAFVLAAILLLLGRLIRQNLRILRQLYIPSSIVAGLLALILGPQVLGQVMGPDSPLAEGVFSANIRQVWQQSPAVFINVVFATLFLGEILPAPRDIWRKASPQVAFGQTLAWGQYVVGLLLGLLVLTPVFGLSPIAGTLIEIGFEGGHGTAAGMAETLTELGFPEGGDLALGLATIGIVAGIVSGIFLANWGRRKGLIRSARLEPDTGTEVYGVTPEHPDMVAARERLTSDLLVDPISLNLGFVGLAVAAGWLILEALKAFERWTWGGEGGLTVLGYIPLFPMALVGGILVQLLLRRLRLEALVMRSLMERIGGVALDITIITALASISLTALGENFIPFALLALLGIAWNVLAFIYLAPRMLPDFWFERGIGDVGQSMGVTATGILLLRMVDPQNRSGGFESFAYKQLFFEPIVGGGLFTAAAPVLVVQLGALGTLLLTGALLLFWLAFGLLVTGRRYRRSLPEA
ncbi:sodium:glutamate symporter [Geitlerinema sp. P-1104]|uniref:sodium/glutamate symporter n=1 Tax=Geitlerinema sp. P-1104 TaxID=2546230 RepID=UPI0014776021|nr:sodium/glutamate symporter [Geitlerinema sp. P-1104]NMG59233.1 sodium:glutamate symporter [Geitlerinema sp. P-1104]